MMLHATAIILATIALYNAGPFLARYQARRRKRSSRTIANNISRLPGLDGAGAPLAPLMRDSADA
jgi:hypothetical protein